VLFILVCVVLGLYYYFFMHNITKCPSGLKSFKMCTIQDKDKNNSYITTQMTNVLCNDGSYLPDVVTQESKMCENRENTYKRDAYILDSQDRKLLGKIVSSSCAFGGYFKGYEKQNDRVLPAC